MELKDKNGQTEAEFLANYRPKDYDRPSVTADIVVFRENEVGYEVLLIQRGNHPYLGKWALPGGFSQATETLEETAQRELEEETHLKNLPMEPIGLFSTPGRDPRAWVMSEAYIAKITDPTLQAQAGDDAAAAEWFQVKSQETPLEVELTFTSTAQKTLHASLQKYQTPGLWGPRTEYRLKEPGELAFDHARIIAYAMQKLTLLQ